jgi:hypothetical protein
MSGTNSSSTWLDRSTTITLGLHPNFLLFFLSEERPNLFDIPARIDGLMARS